MVDGGEGLQGSDNDLWCFRGEEGNKLFDDGIGYIEFDVKKESLDGGGFRGRTTCYALLDNRLDSRCAGAVECMLARLARQNSRVEESDAPGTARLASNFQEGIEGIETFGLCSNVGIGDSTLPDVGVCSKVLDEGITRLCSLELFCGSFIAFLTDLPVLVYEAVGQRQFAKIFLLFGHVGGMSECLGAAASGDRETMAADQVRNVMGDGRAATAGRMSLRRLCSGLRFRRAWWPRHGSCCDGRRISLSQARPKQTQQPAKAQSQIPSDGIGHHATTAKRLDQSTVHLTTYLRLPYCLALSSKSHSKLAPSPFPKRFRHSPPLVLATAPPTSVTAANYFDY